MLDAGLRETEFRREERTRTAAKRRVQTMKSGRISVLVIVIMFSLSPILGIPEIPQVTAAGGLALDGNGFGSANSGSCTWSKTLTTAQKPDVIVALLVINDTTTSITGHPTDTASLSWSLRASQKGPANVQVFFYYAISADLLSADSITFALSSGAVATVCQDFGISGADTDAPFDPNAGMPNMKSDTSTTATLTFNTYNPNDFLIILEGFCASGGAGSDNPREFTVIGGSANAHAQPSNCVANFLQTDTYYKTVSATQSNTVSWTFDTENSPFAIIGDAIQSTPGPLNASVNTGSNVVDVGQVASFTCTPAGGLPPYTYSWTFGDGTTGLGASLSHIYASSGTKAVICIVTDTLGTTANDHTDITVVTDPSITAFTASPARLDAGEKVTLAVSASGGYGALSYSYTNLPASCLSANATSLSCYPTSSGNYHVTVTVTDRAGESANATIGITIGPQRVLGLPQAVGLAVIFVTTAGIGALAMLSAVIALRRKKRRQASTAT